MRRFRPNIVTTGSAPFAEDGWQQLTIANVDFEGVKPCSRCKVRLALTLLLVNCRAVLMVSPPQSVWGTADNGGPDYGCGRQGAIGDAAHIPHGSRARLGRGVRCAACACYKRANAAVRT